MRNRTGVRKKWGLNIGEDEQPESGEESEMVLVEQEEDQGSSLSHRHIKV